MENSLLVIFDEIWPKIMYYTKVVQGLHPFGPWCTVQYKEAPPTCTHVSYQCVGDKYQEVV